MKTSKQKLLDYHANLKIFLVLWQGKKLRTTEKKKTLNFVWDSKSAAGTSLALFRAWRNGNASVIQCNLHIEILDYDWLMNNRVWSGPMKYFVFISSVRPRWRHLWRIFFLIASCFFCLTMSKLFLAYY